MINLAAYGLEENIGLHVVLSSLFWWISVFLVIQAFRYRHLWNVGEMTWTFLFLTFISFGLRELGHFSTSRHVASVRYVFGIWSAVFMTSAFLLLYIKIYQRKKEPRMYAYLPFAIAVIFPLILLYLYLSGIEVSNIKRIMSTAESLVWMAAGSIMIYTTYMLGTHAAGGFTRIFMFFQFSAYAAFTWKFLGLIEILGSPMPYSIREIVETSFGIFATVSMFLLTRMLRELSRHIYGLKS